MKNCSIQISGQKIFLSGNVDLNGQIERRIANQTRNHTFEAIHIAALCMSKAGRIEQTTIRDFDKSSFVEVKNYEGKDVRRIRHGSCRPSGIGLSHERQSFSYTEIEKDAKLVAAQAGSD